MAEQQLCTARGMARGTFSIRVRCRVLAAGLLLGASLALAAPYLPSSDDEVLERLPFAPRDPTMRTMTALRQQLVHEPTNLALAMQVARSYSELGRVSGDPRFSGYAQAALAPWWNLPDPPQEVLLMRATLRQRFHDFDGALTDLAALLKADPRNGQAHLTRALVLQVQGDLAAAGAECAVLSRLAPELIVATCSYGVASVNGHLRESYDALASALARTPQARPEVRAWVLSILADMAQRAGLSQAADANFREALALDPSDHYVLGAYADFLLDEGRPVEALRLLDGRLRTDALMLRYALALKATNSPELASYVEQLRARFAESRLRGDRVHLREEARFALELEGDPAAALRLATENWSVQKEPPDVRILLEAALAAHDTATVALVKDWLGRTGMEDRALTRRMQ